MLVKDGWILIDTFGGGGWFVYKTTHNNDILSDDLRSIISSDKPSVCLCEH